MGDRFNKKSKLISYDKSEPGQNRVMRSGPRTSQHASEATKQPALELTTLRNLHLDFRMHGVVPPHPLTKVFMSCYLIFVEQITE